MPSRDIESRLRAKVRDIQERDPELRDELESVRADPRRQEEARTVAEGVAGGMLVSLEGVRSDLVEETIVLRVGRPVLQVLRGEAQLVFTEAESEVWRDRLAGARDSLLGAAQATGRIEVEGHPQLDWIGTGWLVSPDVVVTNRHVAREFARRGPSRFVFRRGLGGGEMVPTIDFLEELGRSDSLAFAIREVLHIEDDDGPDMALLRVQPSDAAPLARPLTLASRDPGSGEQVAVIGYPARDSRLPEQELMERIFGDVYDKKRLAPGEITGMEDGLLLHDCSTLGGNSGSVVYSLASGEAVGLHFAGRFLEANFAVPAHVVAERLRAVEGGDATSRQPLPPRPGSGSGEVATRPAPPAADPQGPRPRVEVQAARPAEGGGTMVASITIPIHLTVSLGTPVTAPAGGGAPPPPHRGARGETDEPDDVVTEGVPEDYGDREGYLADFLGRGNEVELPALGDGGKGDILPVERARDPVLRYEHFSVVMSRSRRMCFFSAVNVDGRQSRRKTARAGWRTDPRIPQAAQIMGECYGSAPRFSRGHMTRREDPAWGDTAERGNVDSMHVTNTVPQMQTFNAGIWLSLEDYALQHARTDNMRISVFTGPYFRDDDPVRYGVKIPRRFWKVIAFVHDQTGKLTATGYTLSQEDHLREEEFVFGAFDRDRTAQVPIASIERETGLSFGHLASLDPLRTATESVGGAPSMLTELRQIRFV